MKQVLKDRVLIKRIKKESLSSILSIPDDENGPMNGEVLLVGKLVEDIKVGDTILYKENDALPIKINGKEFLVLREYDIIGIL